MDLTGALQAAAGVSSFLGLAAFLAVLYFWQEARRKERTLQGRLTGEIIDGSEIVLILKEFSSDEVRLEALARVMKARKDEARPVLDRIKQNIDPLRLEVAANRQKLRMYVISACVLIALGIGSLIATGAGGATPTPGRPELDRVIKDLLRKIDEF